MTITSPKASAVVSGSILVTGTAGDDQMVRSIHLQVDAETPRSLTVSASWSAPLNTARLAPGPHQVLVFVRDRGLNTTYAAVEIIVGSTVASSPAPTPTPSPAPAPSQLPPPSPTPPSSPSPAPGSPDSSLYVHQGPAVLGVWSDGISGHTNQALEAQIGRRFRGVRNNQRIFEPLPGRDEVLAFDSGATFSVRNAQTNTIDARGNKVATCWADWANGRYDWRLAEIVASIKADSRWTHANPYVLAFQKEMNLNDPADASFATHPTCGTPEEYKSASRHVWAYFRDAGVLWRSGGELLIAWVPSGSAFRNGNADDWDPDLGSDGRTIVGDYYDLVGIDIYDRVESGGHLKTTDPHWLFDPGHDYAIARGKQLIVPEFGVEEDRVSDGVSEKAIVLSNVVAVLASYGDGIPGSVVGVYYSNVRDYWADTSPEALGAFTRMANDRFFSG